MAIWSSSPGLWVMRWPHLRSSPVVIWMSFISLPHISGVSLNGNTSSTPSRLQMRWHVDRTMGYHLSHGTSQDKSHGQSINVQKAFSNAMERPSGFLWVSLGDILGQNRACWAVRMVKEDMVKDAGKNSDIFSTSTGAFVHQQYLLGLCRHVQVHFKMVANPQIPWLSLRILQVY